MAQGPASVIALLLAAAICDPSLWKHVYHPDRLIVVRDCVAVTGTIMDATHGKRKDGLRKEADGDCHGWLTVDKPFHDLLNKGNHSGAKGNLVFEAVCMYNVRQENAKLACRGFSSKVKIPPVGSHVTVTGTLVQETRHAKWREIHPVTSIAMSHSNKGR